MNCLLQPNGSELNCQQRHHKQQQLLHYSIKSATINKLHETVQVLFGNNTHQEYPFVFLQHNCPCLGCYHPSSHSTLRQITELNPENHVASLHLLTDNSGVLCKWDDGHESLFSGKWLMDRRFTNENSSTRGRVPRDITLFTGPSDSIDKMDLKGVMSEDRKLLQLLETVSQRGVCLIYNTPKETGQLRQLADKIGFIRLTHYGHEFTVKSEPNAINLAYTCKRLGFHTDLPYYTTPPGVQMLHCIRQYEEGVGGETHLVDGFRVADQMKLQYPEQYKILCNTPIEFCDMGTDYTTFHKVHRTPLFVCNDEGKVTRIAYSSHVLSSHLPLTLDQVKPLYESLILFMKLCYTPKHFIQFKLNSGEIMVFDNWRMLHGREGFDSTLGERHLEGCYVDWDEINCRIRVLNNRTLSD